MRNINGTAYEPIQNNSICVYEEDTGLVRNMQYSSDIGEYLVYVSNVAAIDQSDVRIINKGEAVRCFPISVSRKISGVEDLL